MTIGKILEKKGSHAAVISPDQSIWEVLDSLKLDDIGAIVVSSDGEQIDGIISERDIVRGLQELGSVALDQTANNLMTKEVITCEAEDTVNDIMSKMNIQNIRHVPVTKNGCLAGIINVGDIVQHRLDQVEREAEEMLDYITNT